MKFTLTIESDNAVFDDELESEVARILKKTAALVLQGFQSHPIMDENGNRVGEWEFDV